MISSADKSSPIVAFLSGRGPDSVGRYLDDILQMTNAALETGHDWVQWCFPLSNPSRAVPGAPVLTRLEIGAVRVDPIAQVNLGRAIARMESFYAESQSWLVQHDHNHLRISRIIRSVYLLVGPEDAEDFLETILHMVAKAGRPVSQKNIGFWQDAAGIRA